MQKEEKNFKIVFFSFTGLQFTDPRTLKYCKLILQKSATKFAIVAEV